MLLARLLDDKFAALYRAGKIHGGVFLGRGQEALSASIGVSLKKGDVFAPLIRDTAGRLAFGEPILDARADLSRFARSARCAGATATSIAADRRKVICR
jgi:TPP-dependent pyruvate/acetoin dehydrogenase alpha subunit